MSNSLHKQLAHGNSSFSIFSRWNIYKPRILRGAVQLPDIINAIPLAEVYNIIIHQTHSDFQEVPFPNHVW